MTDLDLDKLEAAVSKMTPGPWEKCSTEYFHDSVGHLMRSPHSNPLVETQQPGFCVYNPTRNQFFSADLLDCWGPPVEAKIYDNKYDAVRAATTMSCVVTTVPRHNGHFREWEVLP